MTTSMILPQPNPTLLRTAPLGPRMHMACTVTAATDVVQAAEALPVAEFFAEKHGFHLPRPRDLNAPDAFSQYSRETVPYFRNRMRPYFTEQVLDIAQGPAPYDVARGVELARIDVGDIALGGLLTFDAANKLLASVEADLQERLGSRPARQDAVNPSFRGRSIAGRLAFMGAVVAGGLLIDGNIWVKMGIAVGALLIVEAMSYHFGARSKMRQIAANRDSAAQIDEMKNTLQQVKVSSDRLERMRDRIPEDAPHPGPVSPQMRSAMIKEKIGDRRGDVDIIDSEGDLLNRVGVHLKYMALELPDGSKEMRVISPNLIHPVLRLDGEGIVGAGYLLYEVLDGGRRRLRIDGNSTSFPTERDSIELASPRDEASVGGVSAVKGILEGIVAESTEVVIVGNIYRSLD